MSRRSSVPAVTGIGLKPQHYQSVLDGRPGVGFFEVHTENYMGAGGPPHHYLEAVRRDWALSMHGVGLSMGSADGLDAAHLERVAAVVSRYEPALVSEHVSFSAAGGVYMNDLLPVPYTKDALAVMARNVDALQDRLGRRVLMENPSAYLAYRVTDMTEPEFLSELVRRTGCGLLLDVNNVFVSASNTHFDATAYLDAFPMEAVGEIHLAGHHVTEAGGRALRIDDHGSRVAPEVWDLYSRVLARTGDAPTLIEWDTDVPTLDVLLEEAATANVLRAAPNRQDGEVPHADVA